MSNIALWKKKLNLISLMLSIEYTKLTLVFLGGDSVYKDDHFVDGRRFYILMMTTTNVSCKSLILLRSMGNGEFHLHQLLLQRPCLLARTNISGRSPTNETLAICPR